MTSEEKLALIVSAAEDVKAERIETLSLDGKSLMADYFMICTGNSDVHIRAIANRIEDAMEKAKVKKGRIEGYAQAVWVLLDYGDVVAHVMRQEQREYYSLEAFWQNAPNIEALRQQEESKPA